MAQLKLLEAYSAWSIEIRSGEARPDQLLTRDGFIIPRIMCTLIQLIENKELDSYRRVYLAEKPKSKLLPCFAWFVNGPNN